MTAFEEKLLHELSETDTTLVFPSEVAAEFWRKRILLRGEAIRTLESDRFLSWDRFKERTTGVGLRERPANRAVRLIFSSLFLSRVAAGRESLESLVPGAFAWNAGIFAAPLSRMLPGLKALKDAVADTRGLEDRTRRDVSHLESRYREFLESNRLYEPSWQPVRLETGEMRYCFCFPEIIEDFSEYEVHIRRAAFRILSVEEPERRPEIRHFGTTVEEMDWVLSRIAEYLCSGISPRDIIVTLPEGGEWKYLLEEARLYGIPVDSRTGKKVTESPGAAFFGLLSEAAANNLELEGLKRLFLNRAYPWKNRDAGEEIVRYGRKLGILKNYGGENLWKRKLTASGRSDLFAYLDGILEGVRRISSSPSFSDLRVGIYSFIDQFLDVESWSDADRDVFRYSLDSLGDLVKVEGLLDNSGVITPFSIWLSYLSGSVYVPKDQGWGVRIFPYGVTAGVVHPIHFIIGADQAKIRKITGVPGFLREDEKRICGIEDRDLTDAFLSLYMTSGDNVHISFSSQGFDGPGLSPSFFMEMPDQGGMVVPAGTTPGGTHYLEEFYWAGETPLPGCLAACVRDGFHFISSTAFIPSPSGFRFQETPELVTILLEKQRNEEGDIVISPTGFDAFLFCPFGYLVSGLLDAGEGVDEPALPDPRERGIFLHGVLKNFMEEIRENGTFHPGRSGEYMDRFRGIIRVLADEWETRGKAFIGPVWNAHLAWTEERCADFLKAEEEKFSEYRPRDLERGFTRRIGDQPIILYGRIDRLSGGDAGTALIDYKTKVRYTKGDFTVGTQDLRHWQLPIYAWILREDRPDLCCAAYYDIAEGRYYPLFDRLGRAWILPDEFEALVDAVPGRAAAMADSLLGGDYSMPGGESCEGCDLRMVCREKFVLRFDDSDTGAGV